MCDVEEKGKKDANALAIANVGGVFVVLFIGLILSIVVAIAEFVWNARKNRPSGLKTASATSDKVNRKSLVYDCSASVDPFMVVMTLTMFDIKHIYITHIYIYISRKVVTIDVLFLQNVNLHLVKIFSQNL